jgi:hypothetical protein
MAQHADHSSFRQLLSKIVRVPKREIDEREAQYQKERKAVRAARKRKRA